MGFSTLGLKKGYRENNNKGGGKYIYSAPEQNIGSTSLNSCTNTSDEHNEKHD